MSSLLFNYSNDYTHARPGSMKLDDSSIGKFSLAKEFSTNTKRINSIDFSQDGGQMITSSDDDTINLYDCETGVKCRDIMSKKYGADLIRFTHASKTAIHTSTKENDIIRYLSLHDNKYLRYFRGHEKRVVTLAMSPADDTFVSGSLDDCLLLWDLRTEQFNHKLTFQGPPLANYDPEGLVFAVGVNNTNLSFYDVRHYQKGPFNTIVYPEPPTAGMCWKSLKFSPNGKQILITTNLEEFYTLDAFTGTPIHRYVTGAQIPSPLEHPCVACYTPDSQYILCGSVDGGIHVFSTNRAATIAILRPEKSTPEPIHSVQFNPKYMLIGATSNNKLSFWIPAIEEF